MSVLEKGAAVPDICLKDGYGGEVCLAKAATPWLVVYFYPKADTPGCTLEARGFTALIKEFDALGAQVVGVSPDKPEALCKFTDKYELQVTLLSDADKEAAEAFGVWQLKKSFGKESMGVVRTTFLVNADGVIDTVWENVKADGHAEEVLAELKEKAA